MVKRIFLIALFLPSVALAQPSGNPLPNGAATEQTLSTRLSGSTFNTLTGSLTETAPGTDTASSGLNGRLQRIAQRLTSLIAAVAVPTSSAPTTQSVVPVNDSSTSVLAINASRKGGWVRNISASDIYVSFSGTAATSAPSLLQPGDALSLGQGGTVVYTGAVSAIHAVTGQQRSLEVVEF